MDGLFDGLGSKPYEQMDDLGGFSHPYFSCPKNPTNQGGQLHTLISFLSAV